MLIFLGCNEPEFDLMQSVISMPTGLDRGHAGLATLSRLATLTVSVGELEPAFDPSRFSYTVKLPANTPSVTVEATAAQLRDTVTFEGGLHTVNPSQTSYITVHVGSGASTAHYVINFLVDGQELLPAYLVELTVSSGSTIKPDFEKECTEYEVDVPYNASEVMVLGQAEETTQFVAYTPGAKVLLTGKEEEDTAEITVYGPGFSDTVYKLKFKYGDPRSAKLIMIKSTAGAIDGAPFFNPDKKTYNLIVSQPSDPANVELTGIPEVFTHTVEYDPAKKASVANGSSVKLSVNGSAGYIKTEYTVNIVPSSKESVYLTGMSCPLGEDNSYFEQIGPNANASADPVFVQTHTQYILHVPPNTPAVTVVAHADDDATIQYYSYDGKTDGSVVLYPNIAGTPQLIITVSKENRVSTTYTVNFGVGPNGDAILSKIKLIGGAKFVKNNGTELLNPAAEIENPEMEGVFDVTVPYGMQALIVNAIPASDFFITTFEITVGATSDTLKQSYIAQPEKNASNPHYKMVLTVSGGDGWTSHSYTLNINVDTKVTLTGVNINAIPQNITGLIESSSMSPSYEAIGKPELKKTFSLEVTSPNETTVEFSVNGKALGTDYTMTKEGPKTTLSGLKFENRGGLITVGITLKSGSGYKSEYLVNMRYPDAYYVKSTGSDAQNGETSEQAFATLSKAITAAIANKIDKVVIEGELTSAGGDAYGTGDANSTFTINASNTETLTISGGVNQAKLKAGTGKRTLTINGSSNVVLENMIVTGGDTSNNGGGILISGSAGVKLETGAVITGNKAGSGGGVYMDSTKPLIISAGALIEDNTATNNGGGLYINNARTVNMESGGINRNNATGNASGTGVVNGEGGGVYIAGTLSMTGGVIAANSGVEGRGVYNNGIFKMDGAAQVEQGNDVYLPDTKTIDAGDALAQYAPPNAAACITPNSPSENGAITLLSGSLGKYKSFAVSALGGIPYYVHNDGKCYTAYYHVKSGGVDTNNGLKDATALKTLEKAVEKVKANDSRIKTIVVHGTLEGEANSDSGFFIQDAGNITIQGVDDAYLKPAGARRVIYITSTTNGQSNVYFTNIKISGGNGQSDGGGIYMAGAGSTVTLGPGSEVAENHTRNSGKGGGVYINAATLNIVAGAIRANRAYDSTSNNSEKGTGGGIYMQGGNLNMTGGVIGGKISNTNGGSVDWDLADNVNTDGYMDGRKDGNRAANAGGVYISSASVSLDSGALIQFNKSEYGSNNQGGGGLYVTYANVTLNAGSKINYNYAAQDAGGVFAKTGAVVTINEGCEISYNTATFGGGVYPQAGGEIILDKAKINYNHALGGGGGGAYVYDNAKLTIKNYSEISKNTALTNGGGLCVNEYHVYGPITIDATSKIYGNNDTEYENTVGSDGKACYLEGNYSGGSSKTYNSTVSNINFQRY
jgi:hypothetical protein